MGERFSLLKLARVVKGFSQYEVEVETGIRQNILSLYERRLRTPSVQEKEALARLYGYSQTKLFPSGKQENGSEDD